MNKLESLRAARTLRDLAHLLGFKAKGLSFLLYIKPAAVKYSAFTIPKKSGGVREIRAPAKDLLNLQSRLADYLQDCDALVRKSLGLTRTIAHGFVRGRSIMTNAAEHRARRFVLNVDLEDFFGSINFGRVRGFFIHNRSFALDPAIATYLAQIICFENKLPQGAPTSPVVSNLIGHILDIRLAQTCRRLGATYSRYADDLTFSTNRKEFPAELAVTSVPGAHNWVAGDFLRKIVADHGFTLNESKTRLQYADSRQQVTGLVINRKVNVREEYRLHARQMVHRLCSTGAFQFVPSSKASSVEDKAPGSLERLAGWLSFINSVRRFEIRRHHTERSFDHEDRGFHQTYLKFLFYRDFFAAERPVVLLEGKTDNLYLRCAIRRLAPALPHMAKIDAVGKIEVLVRLFRYTNTSQEMYGLAGGTGGLPSFLMSYKSITSKFRATKSPAPLVIVIDNDKGAKGLYSSLEKSWGIKNASKGDQPFYRILGHIYIVPTPKTASGAETCIESLFTPATLATKLGDKTFNPSNDSDGTKEYGKYRFATEVVKKNEKAIDFSGFGTMLKTIDDIIRNHTV